MHRLSGLVNLLYCEVTWLGSAVCVYLDAATNREPRLKRIVCLFVLTVHVSMFNLDCVLATNLATQKTDLEGGACIDPSGFGCVGQAL